jgi:hypothetical protein
VMLSTSISQLHTLSLAGLYIFNNIRLPTALQK